MFLSLSLLGGSQNSCLPASFMVIAPHPGSSWPTDKNWGFGIRQSQIGAPTLILTSCGTLGNSLNPSEPQLPQLNLGLKTLTLKS